MKKTQKNNLIKKCPICGSDNISFQLMQKEVPEEHRKVDDVTYALCNNCGNSWVHQNKSEEIRKKKEKRHLIIGGIIIFAFLLVMFFVSLSYH